MIRFVLCTELIRNGLDLNLLCYLNIDLSALDKSGLLF